MNGLRELSIRPMVAFDEHVANATAERLRKHAADAAALSWKMDEALRNVRRAMDDTERQAAVAALEVTHTEVNRAFTLLGF
jgi:hypothetical protein